MKGCGKSIDGWNRCGVQEMETVVMYCDECKSKHVRDDGYYWVKQGYWQVMYFSGEMNGWGDVFSEELIHNESLEEIDERRIARSEK